MTPSPLPGPSGNVEFFLWLRRGDPPIDTEAIAAASTTRRGADAHWGCASERLDLP